MAVESSVPDYIALLISNLEELKKELEWCLNNPKKVTPDKIKDIKKGVVNLKNFTIEKIKDETFVRDMERFNVLISNLPTKLSDIDKNTINLIFERIGKLIQDIK